MRRYPFDRAVVLTCGFLAGAVLAISIAPGDIFLWVVTGIVLGLFAHAFFVSNVGEEQAWPFARHRRPRHGKKHRLH